MIKLELSDKILLSQAGAFLMGMVASLGDVAGFAATVGSVGFIWLSDAIGRRRI